MASAPSSSSLLTRITKLFSRSEETPSISVGDATQELPAQRLASLVGAASPPLTGKSADSDEQANNAAIEEYERDAAEAARTEGPSYNDWQEHKAGEYFVSDEQEQEAMNDFFQNNPVEDSLAVDIPAPAALPKTPEDFAKYIDDHAEPTTLAAFQQQFKKIGVADITILSGHTVSADRLRGDVRYNIRPANMDELRPEIAKAAAAGRLPAQGSTVASLGGTVNLDERRDPATPRPLDLLGKSGMMRDATAELLQRRQDEGRSDPGLSKNHKAIIEDFLRQNATPSQVADFQQQLDDKGSATLTLVTAQTITASRTNGPKDLPAVHYDIRPATKEEYEPHLAAIQSKVVADQGAGRAATPQTVTDSIGRQNNYPAAGGKETYLHVNGAQGRDIAQFAGKLTELENTLETKGEASIALAPGVRISGSTGTSSFGEAFQDSFTLEYQNGSQKDLTALLQASIGKSIPQTAQNYLDKQPVAVELSGEQARLLIADAHPNNPPAQARALYAITNTDEPVTILQGSVSLDYSADAQGYFAVMDKEAKPALDQKLTQLQAKEDRKYQPSQQQASSQRNRDNDYERD